MTTQTGNSSHAPVPPPGGISPEARLARSRNALHQRLTMGSHSSDTARAAPPSGLGSAFNTWARPAVTALAKRHPYAFLTAGATAGALVVWWRPWRGLLGSLALAALMRQARTWSLDIAGKHLAQSTLNHFYRRGPSESTPR